MKKFTKYLPPLALVGALALVPAATSSFAAADQTNYQELEKFMSVYERVKAKLSTRSTTTRSSKAQSTACSRRSILIRAMWKRATRPAENDD